MTARSAVFHFFSIATAISLLTGTAAAQVGRQPGMVDPNLATE